MEHDDYWKKRFEQLEAAKNKAGAAYYREVEEQFILAQRQIDKEILSWNQRFATNNGVTMSEAKKMLNAKQLAELRWNVNEYIKHGEKNALDGRWMKQLENASARYHISRLEALKLQTQQAIEVLFGNQTDGLDTLMRRIYTDGYYHTAFEIQRAFNVGWDIAEIDEPRLKKILSKPWAADGKDFSERIWSNKTRLINELHTQLTQCCILGKSPNDAIKNLAKKMNTSKGNAQRLVMTESAYFSSAAQRDCFIDLDVEKYEIVATLDSITSTICRALDGKVFETKDYVPGVTAHPFHPRCRSCTAPYFEDEFSLGERAARGEDGKVYYVPSDMRYPEWKKIFVDGGGKNGLKICGIGGIMEVGSADFQQYQELTKVLGVGALKTFGIFQILKYNDVESWRILERNYKIFMKIDGTQTYSPEYKSKLKETYLYFKGAGFEFTEHALGRVVGQKTGKGKHSFLKEDALVVLKSPPNFIQDDGKYVKFYNGLAIIQAQDTNEVISIVVKNKARPDWEEIK